jgi:hypothetical protein
MTTPRFLAKKNPGEPNRGKLSTLKLRPLKNES